MPIKEIRVPRNVVVELPSPVTRQIVVDAPVTRGASPPVVSSLSLPIVDVPNPVIDYPVIDVPTKAEFEAAVNGDKDKGSDQETPDTRDLPNTPAIPPTPVINVGGIEIPIPDPGPLVAAGSLAVVTTVVTLGATIAVGQAKTALEPLVKKLLQPKKKKIKVKSVTPVLHFVPNEDDTTKLIEYSAKGTQVLESGIVKLEQYLRDQVEISAFWEYDNKIIIDEDLSKYLTKEGQKRFKKYFTAPKVIAKKLGAKFAF